MTCTAYHRVVIDGIGKNPPCGGKKKIMTLKMIATIQWAFQFTARDSLPRVEDTLFLHRHLWIATVSALFYSDPNQRCDRPVFDELSIESSGFSTTMVKIFHYSKQQALASGRTATFCDSLLAANYKSVPISKTEKNYNIIYPFPVCTLEILFS